MSTFSFRCPVCGQLLREEPSVYVCPAGHSFDRSRYGYVNLLLSGQSADKRHGDDKAMAIARRDFLEKGFYQPLCDAVCRLAAANVPQECVLLDVGCGEMYYTVRVAQALHACAAGCDISRNVLAVASRRRAGIPCAVASSAALPVEDESCDLLLCIFAPVFAAEFSRVLKNDGVFIHVSPLEDHLLELKQAVYDNIYLNHPEEQQLPGFSLLNTETLRYPITLTAAEDIRALFRMTPYWYKTSVKDQAKLDALTSLTTQAAFRLDVWRKTPDAR